MAALGEVCTAYCPNDLQHIFACIVPKRADNVNFKMAAWLPLPSGFTGYATRFVDPALGFSLGWNYWFKVSENDDLIYKATTARLRET
jgi:hypothetical protein